VYGAGNHNDITDVVRSLRCDMARPVVGVPAAAGLLQPKCFNPAGHRLAGVNAGQA
jgi:hypothetical protein